MKVPYKVFPADKDPGFGESEESWIPVLNAALIVNGTKTHVVEALVDSGAFTTFFHSDLARNCGLRVEDGKPGQLAGVVSGPRALVYYHSVKLCVDEHMIQTTAGFHDKLSFAGILGRHGFFEHFQVLFDPANNPPGFEITRVHRA